MAKSKIKKGAKLMCVPCGRQVVVNSCGSSTRTLWCCGIPMKKKTTSLLKSFKKKVKKLRK